MPTAMKKYICCANGGLGVWVRPYPVGHPRVKVKIFFFFNLIQCIRSGCGKVSNEKSKCSKEWHLIIVFHFRKSYYKILFSNLKAKNLRKTENWARFETSAFPGLIFLHNLWANKSTHLKPLTIFPIFKILNHMY